MQNVALYTGDDKNKNDEDTVKLMTIHAAKGLEFPVVYAAGMEEGLFPSSQSLYSQEDLEEERRLFYVAITRAEKKLFLTYATTRYKYGNIQYSEASRFLNEIPENIMSLYGQQQPKAQQPIQRLEGWGKSIYPKPAAKPVAAPIITSTDPFIPDDAFTIQNGMDVRHEKFGDGKVTTMEGAGTNKIATIFFPNFGEKKIMLKFAKLKILG
jgi:DNA helicase-2/ATP-dependent DNA helicase PcrA